MRDAVLGFKFLMELAALAALGYAGAHFGGSVPLHVLFGVVLPLCGATLWGVFAAPKSPRRLSQPFRFVFKAAFFAAAGAALAISLR